VRLVAVRDDGSYRAVVDQEDGDISHILNQAVFQSRVAGQTVHFRHRRMPFSVNAETDLKPLRDADHERYGKASPQGSTFPFWKAPAINLIE